MKLLTRILLFVLVVACLTTFYSVFHTHRPIPSPHRNVINETQFKIDICYNSSKARRFPGIQIGKANKEEVGELLKIDCLYNISTQCQPDEFFGRITVRMDSVPYDQLAREELEFVYDGGWWRPRDCLPKQDTAIIIPMRNRDAQLPILIRQLHHVLRQQLLHYRIFVVNQDDNLPFNKAKIMNIAFTEARKLFPYRCYIFHDVDLIPEDDRIDYSCKESPMHLSVAVSSLGYRLMYSTLFGGVVMFKVADFERINGFSNVFWVWGGEDDNLYRRVIQNNMQIHRPSSAIARYRMLPHPPHGGRPYEEKEIERSSQIGIRYAKVDGLNSLKYNLTGIIVNKLYTLFKADVLGRETENIYKV